MIKSLARKAPPPPSQKQPPSPTMLSVEQVHKAFGRTQVLTDVSLQVATGRVLCLIGPSGAGKSTLLRCINHLERPDSGHVLVDGALVGYRRSGNKLYEVKESEVCAARARIGMVFQNFNLFPHMTAIENVALAPVVVGRRDRRSAAASAQALLDRVGLGSMSGRYPSELSGGEQQRVAIARALSMDPNLVLFDEPTSALDPELVGDVLDVMAGLARDGMTMVVATHEIQFAREVADEVVFMNGGRIVERGKAGEVLTAPKHERTQAFLRRVLNQKDGEAGQ